MRDINYLYDLLKRSDISLLGYRSKQERLKDDIISKLPHLVVSEIDSSFSFKSFLRDLKLKSILETDEPVKKPEYLVLDLNEIKSDYLDTRQEQIGNIIQNIRQDLYSNFHSGYPQTPTYKLLILTRINSTPKNGDDVNITNLYGGSKPIFMSDVVVVMKEESMKIVKNRFDAEYDVSYEKLKDYNYICNYENNN